MRRFFVYVPLAMVAGGLVLRWFKTGSSVAYVERNDAKWLNGEGNSRSKFGAVIGFGQAGRLRAVAAPGRSKERQQP